MCIFAGSWTSQRTCKSLPLACVQNFFISHRSIKKKKKVVTLEEKNKNEISEKRKKNEREDSDIDVDICDLKVNDDYTHQAYIMCIFWWLFIWKLKQQQQR